jgi:hypothetical protein
MADINNNENTEEKIAKASDVITFICNGKTLQATDNTTPPTIENYDDDDYSYYFYGWSEDEKYENISTEYIVNQNEVITDESYEYEIGKAYYAVFIKIKRQTINIKFCSENQETTYNTYTYKTTIDDVIASQNDSYYSFSPLYIENSDDLETEFENTVIEISNDKDFFSNEITITQLFDDVEYKIGTRSFNGWYGDYTSNENFQPDNYENAFFIVDCSLYCYTTFFSFNDSGDLKTDSSEEEVTIKYICTFSYDFRYYLCTHNFYVGDNAEPYKQFIIECDSQDEYNYQEVENPVLDGKIFLGWCSDEALEDLIYPASDDKDCINVQVGTSYGGNGESLFTYNYYDNGECSYDYYSYVDNYYAKFEETASNNDITFIVNGEIKQQGDNTTPPEVKTLEDDSYNYLFYGWSKNETYNNVDGSYNNYLTDKTTDFELGNTYYAMFIQIPKQKVTVKFYHWYSYGGSQRWDSVSDLAYTTTAEDIDNAKITKKVYPFSDDNTTNDMKELQDYYDISYFDNSEYGDENGKAISIIRYFNYWSLYTSNYRDNDTFKTIGEYNYSPITEISINENGQPDISNIIENIEESYQNYTAHRTKQYFKCNFYIDGEIVQSEKYEDFVDEGNPAAAIKVNNPENPKFRKFTGWSNKSDLSNLVCSVKNNQDYIEVNMYDGELDKKQLSGIGFTENEFMASERIYLYTYSFYAKFDDIERLKTYFVVDGEITTTIIEDDAIEAPIVEDSETDTHYLFFAGWTENEEYKTKLDNCDRIKMANNRVNTEDFEYDKTYYAMIDQIAKPIFETFVTYGTDENKYTNHNASYRPTLAQISSENSKIYFYENEQPLEIENTKELARQDGKIIGNKYFGGFYAATESKELPSEPMSSDYYYDIYTNIDKYFNEDFYFNTFSKVGIYNKFQDWNVYNIPATANSETINEEIVDSESAGPYTNLTTVKYESRNWINPTYDSIANFYVGETEYTTVIDNHIYSLENNTTTTNCDVKIENPTYDKEVFIGWCSDENLENIVVYAGDDGYTTIHIEDGYFSGVENEKNIYKFYAKSKITKGDIVWYVEDEIYQQETIILEKTKNQLVTPPNENPIKNDIIIDEKTISFKFEGWSLESRYSNPIDFATTEIYKDQDLTFYAVFSSELNSSNFEFNLNTLEGDYELVDRKYEAIYNFDPIYSSNYTWKAEIDKITNFNIKNDCYYFTPENLTITTCTLSDVNNITANSTLTLKQEDLIYNFDFSVSEINLTNDNEESNPFYNLNINFITDENKPVFYKNKPLEISFNITASSIKVFKTTDECAAFIAGFVYQILNYDYSKYIVLVPDESMFKLSQRTKLKLFTYTLTTTKSVKSNICLLNTETNKFSTFLFNDAITPIWVNLRSDNDGAVDFDTLLNWDESKGTISDINIIEESTFIYNPSGEYIELENTENANCIINNECINNTNLTINEATMAIKSFTYKEYEKKHKITFYDDINGNKLNSFTEVESKTLTYKDYSSIILTKAETERIKYDFDYWYYLKDNEEIKIIDKIEFDTDKDIYPKYKETNIYYVYFLDKNHKFKKYQGEKITNTDLTSDTFKEVNDCIPSSEEISSKFYTKYFKGWSTDNCLNYGFVFDTNLYHYDYYENEIFDIETDIFCINYSNNRTYNPYANYEINEDLWFYPVYLFEKQLLYIINFKNTDNSLISTVNVKQGNKIKSIPELKETKETNKYKYSLLGWSTDKRTVTEIENPPTQDATYYALYKVASKIETVTTPVTVETPVSEPEPTYKDPNTLIGHLLRFDDKQDLIDFLLELYIEESDKQFGSWRCVKFEMSTSKTDLVVNPTYSEFNTDYYIKFNSSSDLNCLLGVSSATETGKILQTYNAINSSSYLANKNKITQILPYDIFKSFNNSYPRAEFDVKLMYPSEQKTTFDKDDEYEAFYIDFYSKDNTDHGIIFSYSENAIDSDIQPAIDWITFCYDKYSKFMKAKYNSSRLSINDYLS